VVRFFPFIAGSNLASVDPTLNPWLGGAILAALAVVLIAIGWVLVQRRDA
jgi:membrane protein implicated in regulation of membrane protease activity